MRRLSLPGEVSDEATMTALRYLADTAAHRLLELQSGVPAANVGEPGETTLRTVSGENRLYVRLKDGWYHLPLQKG